MSIQEVTKLIMVIKSYYPAHYKDFTAEMTKNLINAWSLVLSTYDCKRINRGLMRYIKADKSGFPPSVGQIINKMPSVYEDYLAEITEIEEHNIRRLSG